MIVHKNYNAAEEISKQSSAAPLSSQVEELQCQNIKRKTSIIRPPKVVNGQVRLTRVARARRKRLQFQPQQSKQQSPPPRTNENKQQAWRSWQSIQAQPNHSWESNYTQPKHKMARKMM